MFFEVCFECGLDVICDVGDVVWWCFGGMICFVQVIEKFKYFVSCVVFDIEGLGVKQVEIFFFDKWIKEFVDIFELCVNYGSGI